MTSPSEILVRAADLIRDTAGLAVAPPWSQSLNRVMAGQDEDCEVASATTTRTAAWIALMSPAVAPALEAVFLSAAVDALEIGPDHHMVDLARAVLREVDTP